MIVVTGGSGCGGDDEQTGATGSRPAETATATQTAPDATKSTINVVGDALDRAGYDTGNSLGTLPAGATGQIELRKGGNRTDLKNSFVTVFQTAPQAERAARELAKPGIEVKSRKNIVVEVSDGSGDDADAILDAAGF